jgi:hypothetical protein
MNDSNTTRRAVAELRIGDERPAWSLIGSRTIHQFWPLLSPHFKGVLLSPQRRPDLGGVFWTWREANGNRPLTAAEFVDVRRRLESAVRSFAGKLTEPPRNDDPGDGDGTADLDVQLKACVQSMVAMLTAVPDSALAGFVCRPESGPMVHSWGAAVPALPYFPDTLDCEINGAVLMGGESAAGLNVVIENRQGTILARAQADASGAFRFPKIAPGNYRIRVTDRGDFPTTGYAVTVERESIVGLELHRGATVEAFGRAASPVSVQPTTPTAPAGTRASDTTAPLVMTRVRAPRWGLRRFAFASALLFALAAGGGWWWLARRSTGIARLSGVPASGWQSARGQATVFFAQSAPSEAHPGGAGRGSFESSRSSAEPGAHDRSMTSGVMPPASTSSPNAALTSDSSSKESSPVDSAALPPLSSTAVSHTKIQVSGLAPATINQAKAIPHVLPDVTAISPAETDTGEDTEKSALDSPTPMLLPAQVGARGSPMASKNAHDGGAAGIGKSGGDSMEEIASPGSLAVGLGKPAAPASVDGNKSGRLATGARRGAGAKSTVGVPQAAFNALGDSPNPGSPTGDGGVSSGDLPADSASEALEKVRNSAANQVADSPAQIASAAPTSDSDDKSVAAELALEGKAPMARGPALRQAGLALAKGPSLPPAAMPVGPASHKGVTAAAAPAAIALATSAALVGDKVAVALPPTSLPSVQPAEATEATAVVHDAPPLLENVKAVTKAKTPRANRTPVTTTRTPAVASQAGSLAETPALPPPLRVVGEGPDRGTPGQQLRVGVSAWESRMVQDLILPTHPVPAGEDDAMERTRNKMLEERHARMPSAFRQPATTNGFALEFSPDDVRPGHQPHWRDLEGAEPVGTNVHDHRAEVSWPGSTPPRHLGFVLIQPSGRELARVSVDPDGAPMLTTTVAVRSWYWIGVECGVADEAAASRTGPVPRLDWRLLSGAPLPESWRRDDHWLGGRGYRIDLPLTAGTAGKASCALALVDPASGWAIVCNIERP